MSGNNADADTAAFGADAAATRVKYRGHVYFVTVPGVLGLEECLENFMNKASIERPSP